jgi:cytochrome c oxidase subunit IV
VKTATWLLALLTAFGLGIGTIYWFLTYEWAGSMLLWGLGAMAWIVAAWSWRRGSMRGSLRADDPDARPGDAAGEGVGSFPTSSAWPLFLTLAVIVVGAALVYGVILLPLGLGLLGLAVLGLMRESRN